MKLFLVARSLLFLILIPGTVAGYIPLRLLGGWERLPRPSLSLTTVVGACVGALGLAILLRCVWDFFATGRGTLAPFDPPRHLVVRGLYRFTRNPMYNGVLAVLLGEAIFFRSTTLVTYAVTMFIIFHLVIVFLEEPALEVQFGDSYRAYRRSVPRWGFTLRSRSVADQPRAVTSSAQSPEPPLMTDANANEHAILTQERQALNRWAEGDPLGYFAHCAEDVTYFDDLEAQQRVDGGAALREYAATFVGKVPPHRYELIDPKVQVYGDVGIVTLRYHPFAPDGTPLTRWKATVVYRKSGHNWHVVHWHWSMVKEA